MTTTSASSFDDFSTINSVSFLGTPIAIKTAISTAANATEDTGKLDSYQQSVRRPLRGIQLKKESVATMWISAPKLKNSSTIGDSTFTSNFLVNSISENRQEKHQTILTFGKDYVYFFGEQPRQVTVNATLLNTANFRWEEEWWYNYEHTLRGTKLAASNTEINMYVDETIIRGFLISANTSKDSMNPHVVNLSFVLHVTKIINTRPVGQIGSNRIDDSDSQLTGNVDLNIEDATAIRSTPITIGEAGKNIYNRNLNAAKDEPGAVGRFLNTAWDIARGYNDPLTKQITDFLYGRNIVVPADTIYANFSSGTAQRVSIDNLYTVPAEQTQQFNNRKTGFYTDNFDEYPFQSIVLTEAQVAQFTATNAQAVASAAAARTKEEQELAKEIASLYGVSEADLLADTTTDASGIPIYGKAVGALSKVAFAAVSIGLGGPDGVFFETKDQMASDITGAASIAKKKATRGVKKAKEYVADVVGGINVRR